MNDFEREFHKTYPAVRKRTGAYMFTLYPPVRPVKAKGKCPMFVMTGKSLFDECGWDKEGRFIGVELKSNQEYKPSLPIVSPDNHASGIDFHQLEALAAVHRDGGHAYLVWKNGRKTGRMAGRELNEAFLAYLESLQEQESTGKIRRGTRSLQWGNFTEIEDLDTWFDREPS